MPAIRSAVLADVADYVSPGGTAEIRLLLQFPAGEITHATVPASTTSRPSRVDPCSEWFYVLDGQGVLWDGTRDTTIDLVPRRCARIAPNTPFQYRTDALLRMLVVTLPQWRTEYHHVVPKGRWIPTGRAPNTTSEKPSVALGRGVTVHDLRSQPDYTAPDGSEIWLLGAEADGSLALCTLDPGLSSRPVEHRTVEELWYVISGEGQISRRHGSRDPYLTELRAGVCVDIGTGITFQFRSAGEQPLELMIVTLPCWPGAEEAIHRPELTTWAAANELTGRRSRGAGSPADRPATPPRRP